MDNEYIKLIDDNNNEIEYRIITTIIYKNKNYIVYTDDTYENNELNVYASIFDPNDDTVFENVETDEEWNVIEEVLDSMKG